MHYYNFNVADYRKDTVHLTFLEHAIYRALLDTYYLNESPLCGDDAQLMRTHCIRNADEVQAYHNVIKDFFFLDSAQYHHAKCDEELAKIYAKSEKARLAADVRWSKSKKNKGGNANASGEQCERNADGMPPNTQHLTPNNKQTSDAEASDNPVEKVKQKRKAPTFTFNPLQIATAKMIWLGVKNIAPSMKEPSIEKWANTIRLMNEVDKREILDIESMFRWANTHEFWQRNILSPDKLRKHYDAMMVQQDAKNNGNLTRPPWSLLPRDDEKLNAFVAKHNLPKANSGEYYPQWRNRLNDFIEIKLKAMGQK